MPNLIQIKRSAITATPGALANGELAYTANGDVLFIGSEGVVTPIAGKRFPGTLTSNQAIVVDSNSIVDRLHVGSATVNVVSNTSGIFLANSTSNTRLTIPTSAQHTGGDFWLNANGAWSQISASATTLDGLSDVTITSVANNNLLVYNAATTQWVNKAAGNGFTFAAQVPAVLAGTGVTVNATGVHIGQNVATGAAVTFLNLTVSGNTTLGDATTDRVLINGYVANSIVPSANLSFDLGSSTLRWSRVFTGNVVAAQAQFSGNVQISGDLIVTGNVTTTDVSNLRIQDPLIFLAGNNNVSDTVDIGLVGQYYDGATVRHTGLFRDATSKEYYLFTNYDNVPDVITTNTIDPTDASFQVTTLYTYLKSGALVANSTAVTITANSTINVNITANSLSLSSALPGTSGGTGLSAFTAEDILVANTTNGFRRLALGTDGLVLQSNGTAVVYNSLDGGTF